MRRTGTTSPEGEDSFKRALGGSILAAAPVMMKGLSILGTAAMFMVGGSIIAHGVPMIEHVVSGLDARAAVVSGVLATVVTTALDALVGIVAGGLALLVANGVKAMVGTAGGKEKAPA